MNWDTIIVGSGFGGSVTALRLAEANMRVLVLERGPWWGPRLEGDVDVEREAYPRGRGMLSAVRNVVWAKGEKTRSFELNPQGLLEFHLHPQILSWTASGVGGGSLIYTNLLMRPPEEFWQAFPAEMTRDELEPYFARFMAMTRPASLPEARRHTDARPRQMARATERLGRRATYPKAAVNFDEQPDGNAAGVHQPPCVHCGECFVGCPTGAKTTLDRTYLPKAVGAGAEIWDRCEVTAIAKNGHGYAVHYCDRRTGERRIEEAPRLVMAAGTYNTLRLLNDAHYKHRSIEIPPALGRQFSPNGDMMSVAWGERSPEGDLGPSYPLLIEARRDTDGADAVYGEVGFPADAIGGERLGQALRAAYIFFAIGNDDMHATVRTGPNGIQLQASRQESGDYYDASERLMDELMAAYGLERTVSNFPAGPGKSHLTSVHPMGGASIGRGPEEGVVDHRGEVFGNPGLYIADGSLYPAAPGVPPSLTIAALAERQAALMVERTREDLPAQRAAIMMPQFESPGREPADIAARPRKAGALSVHAHDLIRLTPDALVHAWRDAPAAEVSDVQGELAGTVLLPRGAGHLPPVPRHLLQQVMFSKLMPWRAKRIVGTRGENVFGFGKGQITFGEFRLRPDTAWHNGKEVLALDYDVEQNPAWLRHLRGELCRLEPALFLGRMAWQNGGDAHTMMFFGLEA